MASLKLAELQGEYECTIVGLTSVRQMKKLFKKFSKSENFIPNVSLSFLNQFLALVRLYHYIYGQFFVIVFFKFLGPF